MSTGASTPSAHPKRSLSAARPPSPRPKVAYQLFTERFGDERWSELADAGAHRQRPLWASTSTKNPAYADTLYVDDVDDLIGAHTVNTLPENTIAAFGDHGTIDHDVEHAASVLDRLADVGVDMEDVGLALEDQGVAAFHESFAHVLDKARQLATP